MRVDVSPDHNGARLAGTLAFLSSGSGNATIALYGTDEVGAGTAPGGDPLVTLVLAKPPASLADGVLVLHQLDESGDVIQVTGSVKWARFKNGAGAWVMDTDASVEGGNGAVQLPTLVLYAGGRCPLSPSVIG